MGQNRLNNNIKILYSNIRIQDFCLYNLETFLESIFKKLLIKSTNYFAIKLSEVLV